jgi:RNA polymerase sigma-70 factor (ECF subfamily)
MAFEYQGREVVARFCARLFDAGRRFDLVPTRANGQPAFGVYLRPDPGDGPGSGSRDGVGLYVLAFAGHRISAMVRFEATVLPAFGLASSLPRAADR